MKSQVVEKHDKNDTVKVKETSKRIGILVFYVCCVIYITLLSRTPNLSHTMMIKPFWSWSAFFIGDLMRGLSVLQNIALFIPLGFLFASICKSKIVPVMCCVTVTIAVETAQFFSCLGLFDVDDIICNAIGGLIGVLLYFAVGSKVSIRKAFVVCVTAGLCGCFIVPKETPIYTTQFWFCIDDVIVYSDSLSVKGTCYVYNRESLGYDIALNNGETTIVANTHREGKQFEASFDVNPQDTYEVLVRFNGYKSISSQTYVSNGDIVFVSNASTPSFEGTDIAGIFELGSLKYYQPEYDVYIYQVGRKLYWLIGKDFDASIIYNLYTNDYDLLPENRRKYGFDNRSFFKDSVNNLTETMNCGKYYLFAADLPQEYGITAVKVGMNRGKEVLWDYCFRVDE